MAKKRYLMFYDYGNGGFYCYVYALNPEAIINKYPELSVIDNKPKWFDKVQARRIEENFTYDIDEEPRGLLDMILKVRERYQAPT